MANESNLVPIPGPKLLEMIGAVTVKWSVLEFLLDNMLYWASDPADTNVEYLLKGSSTRTRWRTLKEILVRDHRSHPGTARLLSLIDTALDLKGERDTIVHGLYSDPTKPQHEALAVLLKGNRVRVEWPVTAIRARIAAQKIDAHCIAVMTHAMQHGEAIGNSIWPNAWRHKDRK